MSQCSKYLLIIDTAHQQARVVLVCDAEVVAKREWENGRQVGIELLKQIDDMLKDVELELHDITRIGVCVGPGGYSSLRAGIVTAQMLVMVGDLELVEVRGESTEEMVREAQAATPTTRIVPVYTE